MSGGEMVRFVRRGGLHAPYDGWLGGSVALPRLGLPGGDGETIDGVGDQAGGDTGDDAEAGLSGGEADANSRVFRLSGFFPEGCYFFQLMLKAVGGDLASEIQLLL